MEAKKLAFADDVTHTVCDLCEVVFNIKSDAQFKGVMGMTHDQMETVIRKVIDALPDHILDKLYPNVIEDIRNICAREFLFFQVQEKGNEAHYEEDLQKFMDIFSRDIQQRIDTYKGYKAKVREEGRS